VANQSNRIDPSREYKRQLTTSVNTTPANRELLPRSGDPEVEPFVVVVLVWVVVAADLLVGLEVFAALGDGGGDLAGGVALFEGLLENNAKWCWREVK
jgi:hypothetical protein